MWLLKMQAKNLIVYRLPNVWTLQKYSTRKKNYQTIQSKQKTIQNPKSKTKKWCQKTYATSLHIVSVSTNSRHTFHRYLYLSVSQKSASFYLFSCYLFVILSFMYWPLSYFDSVLTVLISEFIYSRLFVNKSCKLKYFKAPFCLRKLHKDTSWRNAVCK